MRSGYRPDDLLYVDDFALISESLDYLNHLIIWKGAVE